MSTRSYTHVSIEEAASMEIVDSFVEAVKYLDKDVATRRLAYMLNFYGHNDLVVPAMNLFMAKFASLKYNKTSADE
jgi:hypothetical protein